MPSDAASPGGLIAALASKTNRAAWGGFNFLDRESVLVDEDGGTSVLDPELASVLQSAISPFTEGTLTAFLNEVMDDLALYTMEDLGGESLEALLEGILGDDGVV